MKLKSLLNIGLALVIFTAVLLCSSVEEFMPRDSTALNALPLMAQSSTDSCPNDNFIPSGINEISPMDCAARVLQEIINRINISDQISDVDYLTSRTLTRREFASVLNAVLNEVNVLLMEGRTDNLTRQDIDFLQEYIREFWSELRTIQCGSLRGSRDEIGADHCSIVN